MIFTGLEGYLSCAVAGRTSASEANRAAISRLIETSLSIFVWISSPTRQGASRRPDALQAVGSVLDGKEHHIGLRCRHAGMHCVGGHIEDRSGLHHHLVVADPGLERAFQHVDPLL